MSRDIYEVTPDEIKALSPCAERWEVYVASGLSAKPVHALADLIDSNGLDDCLWVLDRLPGLTAKRTRVAFAAWCAESVAHLWDAKYPTDENADVWAAAWDAARAAARDAAWAAARAAAWAAARAAARDAAWDAARDAARDAAWAAAWARQADALRRLLTGQEPPNGPTGAEGEG